MDAAKCPFLHGSLPTSDAPIRKPASQPAPGTCPFSFGLKQNSAPAESKCPYGFGAQPTPGAISDKLEGLALDGHSLVEEQARVEAQSAAPKCPMGYDADTVKVGPLSCLVCKSLLFHTVRLLPCRHLFCRSCANRLDTCGLCGGEKRSVEQDDETRMLDQNVNFFVEKYARRKRRVVHEREGPGNDGESPAEGAESGPTGRDLSLEQGGLLLQLAMRAYAGRNDESALHLLRLCEEDLRSALAEEGVSSKVLCQLGAVAGARGDFSRSAQDLEGAASAYQDSAKWLELVEEKDAEVVHDLSVAYNKLGDLHFLTKGRDEARKQYLRALQLRQSAHSESATASQVLDLVVSFTKVADLDRASNKEKAAVAHFRAGSKLAAELGQKRETYSGALEQKRLSLLGFILAQLKELGEEVSEANV